MAAKEKDPLSDSSMSWPLSIASVLMLLATFWAIYDEVIGLRPWKGYQRRFRDAYMGHLDSVTADYEEQQAEVIDSPTYTKLTEELAAQDEICGRAATEIDQTLNWDVNPRIAAFSKALQQVRGRVNSMIYGIEKAPEGDRDERRSALDEFKIGPFEVTFKKGDERTTGEFTFDELIGNFNSLKEERGRLIQARSEATRPADRLRTQRAAYLSRHLPSLSTTQLDGLKRKLDDFDIDIRQIHVADVDLVDRCESCHLGIREPIELTEEDMGGQRVFVSHPRPELLEIHDPEELGCSPCHGGNGVAITSKKKAHGQYKHWLWPLFESENTEAGCLQCHEGRMHVDGAPMLNRGIELFSRLGCWGCHRREGFNTEVPAIQGVQQALGVLARSGIAIEKKIDAAKSVASDRDATDEEVVQALADQDALTLELSAAETERGELVRQGRSLLRQRKRPGPNLKEIRAKVQRDWIPVWLEDTHKFRPSTRMPQFRFVGDQLKAVSAFIWQEALDRQVPKQAPGDAASGKELFESRGCLACHSMGEGDDLLGADFAANLSRVGEKLNYDYLVRWIHNPRERLAPYSPSLGRDLTEADYQKKGLPFEFSSNDAMCPVTGDAIVNQNMTVMPSLRLTWDESRDIASYLMTKKRGDFSYPAADYMDDASLRDVGFQSFRHFGCAGCHETAGFENEGLIGTELTVEGSKPIERLDFGHVTHEARHEGWYNHKGFFQRKLGLHTDDPNDSRNVTHRPEYFDRDKERPNPLDRLRMPDFHLNEEQNTALTTFLLGSVDSRFPARFYHNPVGPGKDIADGWEVLNKYNCVGCHQVQSDEKPKIQDLPWYQRDLVVKAPPSLVGQGFRAEPEWLAEFLANPSLKIGDQIHQNGIRPYLAVRMPTFDLSEMEVGKLVRFFAAMAKQPTPFIAPEVGPLSSSELEMARDAFSAADCLKCHAAGETTFSDLIIAPDFVYTKQRLKSEWVARWMIDPAQLMPGTQMPTGLFEYRADEGRWVTKGVIPDSMKGYGGDHVDLFVRYLWQFTEQEGALMKSRN